MALAIALTFGLQAGAAIAATPVPGVGCPPATSTPLGAPPQSPPLSEATAPPAPAAEALIACIATTPILGSTLAHWTAVAEHAATPSGKASAAPTTAEDPPANQALSFLISSDWVLGEARALGIHISTAQVRRSYDRIRAQQFHKRSEFRAFLRSSGETVADLLFRVRLNVTSNRVQRHFELGRHSAKQKEQALARFVGQFKRKWRAQTYCAAAYLVNDCGNSF